MKTFGATTYRIVSLGKLHGREWFGVQFFLPNGKERPCYVNYQFPTKEELRAKMAEHYPSLTEQQP